MSDCFNTHIATLPPGEIKIELDSSGKEYSVIREVGPYYVTSLPANEGPWTIEVNAERALAVYSPKTGWWQLLGDAPLYSWGRMQRSAPEKITYRPPPSQPSLLARLRRCFQ